MKKNKFIMIDLIMLLLIFGIIEFYKEYIFDTLKNNGNSIYLVFAFSALLLTVYIVRFFVRPPYELVKKLYGSSWKISGYYSRIALRSEKNYVDSYDFWVKINLKLLIIFFIINFFVALLNKFIFTTPMFLVDLIAGFSLSVIGWIITWLREYKNDKKI
ncbi:MAG: hypothetical protein MRZ08_05580 [Anaerococcus sp.]|uniref:hypothetical protein n=1 Tax=Anaerococcus sp. TaxID=1872515 RepID=UPI002603A1E6|nr:hypothetical protein [Anaerococcus sp.]MCI5972494.1 hypothetical protein [Anaerococcus sp.]MDY2928620.1 hypothetical protein [Anaerococcus sp.]